MPVLKVSILERVDCGHLTINPEAEGALMEGKKSKQGFVHSLRKSKLGPPTQKAAH